MPLSLLAHYGFIFPSSPFLHSSLCAPLPSPNPLPRAGPRALILPAGERGGRTESGRTSGGGLTCYVMQEAEDSLEDWARSLTELATMKTDLSQYIIADDVVLLQEQVEHLRCQWEELCLKVGTLGLDRVAMRISRQTKPQWLLSLSVCLRGRECVQLLHGATHSST